MYWAASWACCACCVCCGESGWVVPAEAGPCTAACGGATCGGAACGGGAVIWGTGAGAGAIRTAAPPASPCGSIDGGAFEGGLGGLLCAPPRRGYARTGSPFQSFQVSVAMGGRGGLLVNSTSNTARLTSLPVLAVAMCAST